MLDASVGGTEMLFERLFERLMDLPSPGRDCW